MMGSNRISSARQSTEKDAKALHTELTKLLNKKDPWHQDVVFARENLRRHCLALIFQPISDGSNGTTQGRRRMAGLNLLFASTSHAVIHHFRQRLSAMDKAIASDSASGGSSSKANSRSSSRKGSERNGGGRRDAKGAAGATPTPAQRKRLLHSFRDFLGKEETFWRDLLIRIVGVFDVEEARPALRILQLGVGDWEPDPQFGENPDVHEQAVLLCHRALICFGDLARYRELYSESRPTQQNPQKPRGGKSASAANGFDNKDRSYSRAYEAYQQARLLVPDDGNPSNQLAVLAGYQHDHVSAIYHYHRALCVRSAFTTARLNLAATYEKILKQWEADKNKKTSERNPPRARVGSYADIEQDDSSDKLEEADATALLAGFKESFCVLHAMLYHGSHLEDLPVQFTTVTRLFSKSIAKRVLPSDIIVKCTVTAVSAWWYSRMFGKILVMHRRAGTMDSASHESSALMHALAIIAELIGIAVLETRDVELHEALQSPPTAPVAERPMLLAQSITAVLRRALPALRIASMWLISNADYLAKFDATSPSFKPDDVRVSSEVCAAVRGFWSSYATFANALSQAFPIELLPVGTGDLMLEEDVDMLGFTPLRRSLKDRAASRAAKNAAGLPPSAAEAGSSLHPNEEQVLRLGDLLADANLLAQSEACPIILEGGFFTVRQKPLNPTSQPWGPSKAQDPSATSPHMQHVEGEAEDLDDFDFGSAQIPSPDEEDYEATEDDVLDLAMRVATGTTGSGAPDRLLRRPEAGANGGEDNEDDDDEDDIVLYPSRVVQPAFQPQPNVMQGQAAIAPSQGLPGRRQASPPGRTSALANQQPTSNAIPGRTASDLLLQVLQGNSLDLGTSLGPVPGAFNYAHTPSVPSTSPFGSIGGPASTNSAGNLSSRSIWSTQGGALPPPASISPALHHQGVTGRAPSGLSPFNSAGSAEALFNSMPNQSQSQGKPAQDGNPMSWI